MNKLYISPEFEIVRVEMIQDVICSSGPETFSSYVDPNPGDWDDDPAPSDDGIEW